MLSLHFLYFLSFIVIIGSIIIITTSKDQNRRSQAAFSIIFCVVAIIFTYFNLHEVTSIKLGEHNLEVKYVQGVNEEVVVNLSEDDCSKLLNKEFELKKLKIKEVKNDKIGAIGNFVEVLDVRFFGINTIL